MIDLLNISLHHDQNSQDSQRKTLRLCACHGAMIGQIFSASFQESSTKSAEPKRRVRGRASMPSAPPASLVLPSMVR